MTTPTKIKSVLYVCNMNQIRSPMAEFLTRSIFGDRIYAQSAGIYTGDQDGFMITVMQEQGIDVSAHEPESLRDLDDTFVDLVVTLTDQAQDEVAEFFTGSAVEIEHWPIDNPSIVIGNRDAVLSAYRKTRVQLEERIRNRFG